ncbi:class I SAM-dependent methyltransferase [Methylocella sp.]|uniref:class I SAM-dependent methyltransferase n=1 Tax=Methylocella sp. TaxID=1978226 RepID=UPI003783C1CD
MNQTTPPTSLLAATAVETDATASACPCCGSTRTQTIYRVAGVPVHSCVLLGSEDEAKAFPRRDLQIAFCDACGFLFNEIFDASAMSYAGDFEESQHFSDTFNAFARGLAGEIAQRCDVRGKEVLEIGCGKGEFLRELCRVGGATGVGVDPGYRADPGRGGDESVRFVVDYYRPERDFGGDVVLCRHTLEHIGPTREFVQAIRAGCEGRPDAEVVFETPDVRRVLEEGAFWDMYYEHCSYFSAGTHARLFRALGFDVHALAVEYGGQYIVQYARPAAGPTAPRLPLEDDLEAMRALARDYPARVAAVQDYWRNLVLSAVAGGRRVALWGGGSKAVSFLTTLGLADEISAVVDVNPYKQGRFMPGAGRRVGAPSELASNPPDVVIVMNPIYVPEITAALEAMGLRPSVVAVGA